MRNKLFVFIIGFFFLVACKSNSQKDKTSFYKRHLPESAIEIKEFYWADNFLPDYEYYLKAKINRLDFKNYCDSLKMILHTENSIYSDNLENLNTFGGYSEEIIEWWDSDSKQDSLFVWQNGHEWNIARHNNGYLYLYAHEH